MSEMKTVFWGLLISFVMLGLVASCEHSTGLKWPRWYDNQTENYRYEPRR